MVARLESLERREVLSTATPHPFIIVPSHVDAGQTTTVNFQLPPGSFRAGKGHSTLLLNVDTLPAPGSAATTNVTGITGPSGQFAPIVGPNTASPIVRIAAPRSAPASYVATVSNSGPAAVGFGLQGTLVGDVNGDLKVDARDLNLVLASYGGQSGDGHYSPAADFNRDGRVGQLDYSLARQNFGARGSYIPTLFTAPAATPTPVATPATAAVPATPTVSASIAVSAIPVAVTSSSPVFATGYAVTPVSNVAPTTQVVIPQVSAAPSGPGLVLVPAGSVATPVPTAQPVTWSPQAAAFYPTAQYGNAVPSGPLYATTPYAAASAPSPTTYYAPAAQAPPGYYVTPAPSNQAYTYSSTPNGTTPMYLTPVVQQAR